MKRFYENMTGAYRDRRGGFRSEPMPKARALQEAKSYLRSFTAGDGSRPYGPPAYWAAFVLQGDW
jgi:CHAT domain-containing protein